MYNITFLYLGAPTERFYREALDEYEKRLAASAASRKSA